MPDTRTITGVELVRVGTWNAHTGTGEPWTVTAEDLRAAVAAYEAGVAVPVVKLGHSGTDDTAPALGTVANLRLTDGGRCLVGDFVGVPRALAAAMASQYPNRSVEGLLNYAAPDGQLYRLVLEAVSLLGAVPPAVKGLAPVPVAASRVTITAPAPPRPRIVPAVARLDSRDRAVRVAAARRRRTHRPIETRG